MNDDRASELMTFQVKKDIGYLYKRCLGIMEDVRDEHLFMLEKLSKQLPKEYHAILDAANSFDDNKFAYIRKKILDAGNDAMRSTDIQVGKFDIQFQSNVEG